MNLVVWLQSVFFSGFLAIEYVQSTYSLSKVRTLSPKNTTPGRATAGNCEKSTDSIAEKHRDSEKGPLRLTQEYANSCIHLRWVRRKLPPGPARSPHRMGRIGKASSTQRSREFMQRSRETMQRSRETMQRSRPASCSLSTSAPLRTSIIAR
jgi:hypothetical protein